MKQSKEREISNSEKEGQELERKIRELSIMYEISKIAVTSLELHKTLQQILSMALSALDCEIGSILLLDKSSKELRIEVAQGLPEEIIKSARAKIGENISGWVAEYGEALFVENIEEDQRFSPRDGKKYHTKSLISAPLKIKNEVVGVININNKRSREVFSYNDFTFLKAVATQIALVIENVYMHNSIESTYMRVFAALIHAIDAKEQAIAELKKFNATQFDPEVVQVFLKAIK